MGIYKTTREIRQHVEVLYKRRLTSDDVRSIKKRLSRADGRSEARRVSDLLKGQGNVEIKLEENIVRFVFFVPRCISEDILKNSEVILADATHQLNYGGYVLWHAMLVDDTGLGRSFFYAILPNESGASYRMAVSVMKEMCPGTSSCRTIVVDRSLAQFSAFRQSYPSADVVFCRFHILKDMKKKCNKLQSLGNSDKLRVSPWMRNMVYADTEVTFKHFLATIAARSPEAHGYLARTWLPYINHWAGYALRNKVLFGNLTTNRVETENRPPKPALSK
ncbi:hypothetical protein [Streptococcus dysgalactiae]|uniref:hypothetical protein n=1 Tax=Streptococcus dysgalactiae TaxID=1334 RepID=UPI001951CF7A|nr:hypothetical protein [Streptococcus dysgalactiae]MBM6549417.1 hypothetical protein [Streptococcus dysgalactiae subsp. equisimilis]